MQHKRLIPTSEEILEHADGLIKHVEKAEREAWAIHPCTLAALNAVEAARMEALEYLESGPQTELQLAQFTAQAQMAKNIYEDLVEVIRQAREEKEDDDRVVD